jgi:hypothetical protein
MISTTSYYLIAHEIAYRQERIAHDWAAARAARRFLRRPPRPVRHATHRRPHGAVVA